MRGWKRLTWGVLGATALSGCAVSTPRELLDARDAYQQASAGPAVQYSPDTLGQARLALDEANRAFLREHATERTRTLAYVALRKAQLAEVQARMVLAEQEQRQAEQQLAQAQATDAERSQRELLQARTDLAEAQHLRQEAEQRQLEAQQQTAQQQLAAQQQQTAQQQLAAQQQQEAARIQAETQRQQQEAARIQADQEAKEQAWRDAQERQARLTQDQSRIEQLNAQLEQERQARLQAEQRASQAEADARTQTEAVDQLRQIQEVRVKEEARGLVLTLSGSVLFPSGSAELLSPARQRLDEVAAALKKTQNSLVIEGHSDSLGAPAVNQELSYLRAESVRRYLIDRGVDGSRIRSEGLGSEQPIASNATAEGRANNRRVEIVLQRDVGGSGAPSK